MCDKEKFRCMGLRSWETFQQRHKHREQKKIMAERGHKGWEALVRRFNSEVEAKEYVSRLARANYFKHTRPIFARSLIERYFNKFPNLKKKF